MTRRVAELNSPPSRSPWQRASANPARASIASNSVALAAAVDERLRHLRDAAGGVPDALLEQQPAGADQAPVLLGEAAHERVAVHRLDHQPAARAQHAADLGERALV